MTRLFMTMLTPTSRDDGQWDRGGQPHRNQTRPQYGGQMRTSNQSWPAVRAINLEDPRGDGADEADDGNLEDGADDGGFNPSNYKGADSTPSTTTPLLPPHIKAAHALHTTMNSRSSGATLVTKQDTSHGIALSTSRPSRIRRV